MEKRKCYEQEMVDELKKIKKLKLIHYSVRKNPDVSFKCKINNINYYAILESKLYNKSNRSNYPKQLLSEILINRGLVKNKEISEIKNYQTIYGILLNYDNQNFDGVYDFLKDYILIDDWKLFGKTYNCEYVFLFDKTGRHLYYCGWDSFLDNPTPIKYI